MPITYNNLFHEIASFENLYLAYLDAIKGRKTKPEALNFYVHHEERLQKIHDELEAGTWTPGEYSEFLSKTEVKRRIINAPKFADRVVHMAFYRKLMPLLESKWIFDSYACRCGKGGHKAAARVQKFLQNARRNYSSVYVLQCDISKFYPSIYKPYLMERLRRTIRDRDVLNVLEKIYFGFNGSDTGIPIGAATSQMAANVVLDALDHFAKEELRIKYYIRYMDDFVIIGGDKAELWRIKEQVATFLKGARLSLNPKSQIYPASHGVDFVGYRTWATHILPRKRNVKAAKLRFKDLSHRFKYGEIDVEDARTRVASFLGYMQHCSGRRTTKSTLKWLKLQRRSLNVENGTHQNDDSQPAGLR